MTQLGISMTVLLAVGALAAFIPVHRAGSIDPNRVLRHE